MIINCVHNLLIFGILVILGRHLEVYLEHMVIVYMKCCKFPHQLHVLYFVMFICLHECTSVGEILGHLGYSCTDMTTQMPQGTHPLARKKTADPTYSGLCSTVPGKLVYWSLTTVIECPLWLESWLTNLWITNFISFLSPKHELVHKMVKPSIHAAEYLLSFTAFITS